MNDYELLCRLEKRRCQWLEENEKALRAENSELKKKIEELSAELVGADADIAELVEILNDTKLLLTSPPGHPFDMVSLENGSTTVSVSGVRKIDRVIHVGLGEELHVVFR